MQQSPLFPSSPSVLMSTHFKLHLLKIEDVIDAVNSIFCYIHARWLFYHIFKTRSFSDKWIVGTHGDRNKGITSGKWM